MIELDELKQKWAEYDAKLDLNIQLTRQLLTAKHMNRAQWALRRMALFLMVEGAITLAVIMVLGEFTGNHIETWRFFVPAAFLNLFQIALLVVLGQQIRIAMQIDYSEPIAVIQKQLTLLRLLSLRSTQWTFLLAPLLWTPLLIVGLKGLLHLDAYQVLGTSVLLCNLAVGLAIIPVALWLAKRFSGSMSRSPIMQRFVRGLAGYNLNEATRFLETLTEFENSRV